MRIASIPILIKVCHYKSFLYPGDTSSAWWEWQRARMQGDLTIRQSKFGRVRTFEFGHEKLVYTMRDSSGERQFAVPYQSIDVMNPSVLSVKKRRLAQQVGLVSFAVSFLLAYINNRVGTIASVISIVLFLFVYFAQARGFLAVRFTSLTMAPVPAGANSAVLTIICDKHHDMVIAEIKQHWRDRLRTLYGEANLANDPRQEEARLRWLKDRNVISDVEFSEQMQRLHSLQNQAQGRAGVPLN